MNGWKRMLYGFALVYIVTFLTQLTALDVGTAKAAAYSAAMGLIPVVINYLNPLIKQYGLGSGGGTSVK